MLPSGEHTLWAYPQALLDAEPAAALEAIAAAGIGRISVAAAYHSARLLMPHNPRRTVITLDPGAAYFHPNPAAYPAGGPTPLCAAEYRAADPLATLCKLAPQAGLSIQAWVALLHNSRLGALHPELTLHNVFGDRYQHALCPAHPAVRAYAVALVGDLGARYPLTAIDLEAASYLGYPHASHHDKAAVHLTPFHQFLLSVCFCPHCRAAIAQANADPASIAAAFRAELRKAFAGTGSLAPASIPEGLHELIGGATIALMAARAAVVDSLLTVLRAALPPHVMLLLRATSSPCAVNGKTGGAATTLARHADGLVYSFLNTPFNHLEAEIAAEPDPKALDCPTWAGLSVAQGMPACRDAAEFAARIALLRTRGFTRYAFYAYGLMPAAGLDWIAALLGATDANL